MRTAQFPSRNPVAVDGIPNQLLAASKYSFESFQSAFIVVFNAYRLRFLDFDSSLAVGHCQLDDCPDTQTSN
jgi:hypothetical protein